MYNVFLNMYPSEFLLDCFDLVGNQLQLCPFMVRSVLNSCNVCEFLPISLCINICFYLAEIAFS